MDGKRNAVIRERCESSFRDDVFAVLQDPAGESPQEKSQGLFLGFEVRKGDHDHGSHPFESLAEVILSQADRKQNSGLPVLCPGNATIPPTSSASMMFLRLSPLPDLVGRERPGDAVGRDEASDGRHAHRSKGRTYRA